MADFYWIEPPAGNGTAVSFNDANRWSATSGGTGGAGIPGVGDTALVDQDASNLLVDSAWEIETLDMTGATNSTQAPNSQFRVTGSGTLTVGNVITDGAAISGALNLIIGSASGLSASGDHEVASIEYTGGVVATSFAVQGNVLVSGATSITMATTAQGGGSITLDAELSGAGPLRISSGTSYSLLGVGNLVPTTFDVRSPVTATAYTGLFEPGQVLFSIATNNNIDFGGPKTYNGNIRVTSGAFVPTHDWTQTGVFLDALGASSSINTATNDVTINATLTSFIRSNGTITGNFVLGTAGNIEGIIGTGTHGDYTLIGPFQATENTTGGNWTVEPTGSLDLNNNDLTLNSLTVNAGGLTENMSTITTTGDMTVDGLLDNTDPANPVLLALQNTVLNIGGVSDFDNTSFTGVNASGSLNQVQAFSADGNVNATGDTDPATGLSPTQPNVLFDLIEESSSSSTDGLVSGAIDSSSSSSSGNLVSGAIDSSSSSTDSLVSGAIEESSSSTSLPATQATDFYNEDGSVNPNGLWESVTVAGQKYLRAR